MPVIKDYIYMMVSNDKYQLPICVADSAQELAEKVGVKKGTIYSSVLQWEKGKNKKGEIYKDIEVKYETDYIHMRLVQARNHR